MKTTKLFAIAALCLAAAACSSPSKQMEQVQNLGSACTPEVLTSVDGMVNASVELTFPEKYFSPKAILEIVPVIVYDGGEAASATVLLQGEKVKANNPVVPKVGGKQTIPVSVAFAAGMERSYLELRSTVVYGKDGSKRVALPSIKVADGVNTTYTLYKLGAVDFRVDNYQDTLHFHEDALVHFEASSAMINPTERNRESIHAYDRKLKEIQKNPRNIFRNTQILAYASPEGGKEFNHRLTDHRAKTSSEKWVPMTRGVKLSAPELSSLGQDWEGFKAAVEASDLPDKGLIIRVLSMYEDPAQREQEIRNMASIYWELKKDVLPELRRSTFVVNYDFVNYTSEELKEQKANGVEMDEVQLLHLGATAEKIEDKTAYYKEAYTKYNSADAAYNLAVISVMKGEYATADRYVANLPMDADVCNIKGIVAANKGDRDAAIKFFDKAEGFADAVQNKGAVQISKGEYAEAMKTLSGTGSYNEALAAILTGNLVKAEGILKGDCACQSYLKAIVAARRGDSAKAASLIKKASENPSLKARAEKDIEFAAVK